MLLPPIFEHLVFYVALDSESAVFDVLMDMAGAVVAEHVDVKSVFGVFVVEPSFGEIASGFVSGCPILPVPKAKVG